MGCCGGKEEEIEGLDEEDQLDAVLHAGDDTSRVELSFKCKGIKTAHGGPPAGCSVAVYLLEGQPEESAEQEKTLVGKTETKHRTRYPVWSRQVHITYAFEQVQYVVFELFEEKGSSCYVLGTAQVKLRDVIEGSPLNVHLKTTTRTRRGEPTEKVVGVLSVAAEETNRQSGPIFEVIMEVGCSNLDSKNLFGAGGSDPFLVISRVVDGQFQTVVKTEYITGVTCCDWKPIVVKLDKLCKGDFNTWLLFEVWDFENSGKHQLIGYTRQTLAYLSSRLEPTSIDLHNDSKRGKTQKKLGKKNGIPAIQTVAYENSGLLHIKSISIDTSHSFLEYVKAGFEINLTICCDFSSSNGATDSPDSLHYKPPSGTRTKNEYVSALEQVVGILGEYDKDKEFTFWGFGAQPKGYVPPAVQSPKKGLGGVLGAKDNTVNEGLSHIFPVSGDYLNPYVQGVEGVVQAYWECLEDRMVPAEPTHMTPCLSQTYKQVEGKKDIYQIVLFVTDGQVNDMTDLIDLVVDASETAMSIIIIGVGQGPFNHMQRLSADDVPLQSSDKRTMRRDIVGFVPYREFQHSLAELRRETLKEVPAQFTSWAKVNKIKPTQNQPEGRAGADRQTGEPSSPIAGMGRDNTVVFPDSMLSGDADQLAACARAIAAGEVPIPSALPLKSQQPEGPAATPDAPDTVPHKQPDSPEPQVLGLLDPPRKRKGRRRRNSEQSTHSGFDSHDGSSSSVAECEWDSFSDDDTGRRYYYNSRTQISVWNEPPAYSNWKSRYRPDKARRADNPKGRMINAIASAERVASERAAALAAERHRAEEAEATAALLASEAVKLRRFNRELQNMYGAAEGSPPRGAPASMSQPRAPPQSPDLGPAQPKSMTRRYPVPGDHFGSEAGSPRGDVPYTPLRDDVRRTPSRSEGANVPPPRLEPNRIAMLQCEARAWRGSRRS
eukprot:Hpha_TRINITY_DN17112_c0_g1::TRINITY_DN17112_c0_g1_i1::g.146703::m.146703